MDFNMAPTKRSLANEVDYVVNMLRCDSNAMASFAGAKSEPELKFGMQRLREDLRRVYYKKKAFHKPGLFDGLYKRCDTVAEVNQNEKFIAESVRLRIQNGVRADADDGLIFARELERIDPRRYEKKYQPLGTWRKLVSQTSVEPGLDRITYRIEDGTGEVEPVTVGRSENIPYVGASTEEFSNKVVAKTIGYRYNIMELHRAAFAGVPLQDRYQRQVSRAYETNLNKVMFNGDSLEGLVGLTGLSGITSVEAAAPGTGTSTVWDAGDKTNDEIFGDVRRLKRLVAANSQFNYSYETPVVIGMAPDPYNKLLDRMDSGTNTTLIDFIMDAKKLNIVDIVLVPEFAGVGIGSTDIMMMIPDMDAEVIEAYAGTAPIWQAPQFIGLDIRYPSIQYHGGIVNRFAIGIGLMYGI